MSTSYATPEGLRAVLIRLHDLESVGHWPWRRDPEAERLMRYSIRKYRRLAYIHHCEPDDAGYAAFEAMRSRAVRLAQDPWAVVTTAVQASLIAEERATGLLCSTAQARRREVSRHHDARRFCEYETDRGGPEGGFHPLLHLAAPSSSPEAGLEVAVDMTTTETDSDTDSDTDADLVSGRERSTTVAEAKDTIISLLISLRWPDNTATCAVDYICKRLEMSKNREAAHSLLRRDQVGRASLDLDRNAWSVLLRLVLGSPEPDLRHTRAGRGLLLLLLIGEQLCDLLADDGLVFEISQAAPKIARRSHV